MARLLLSVAPLRQGGAFPRPGLAPLTLPSPRPASPLSLVGPDGGLTHVTLQNLGWFLGPFGLHSDPEPDIPLRAGILSAWELQLPLP